MNFKINKLYYLLIVSVFLVFSCQEDDMIVPVEDILDGDYKVELNPSGLAPLTATVEFETVELATITFRLADDEDYVLSFDEAQKEHEYDIFGLFQDRENELHIELKNSLGESAFDTLFIKTDSLPYFLPDIEIVTAEKSMMESGWTLCCMAVGGGDKFLPYPIAFDENGEIRSLLTLADLDYGFSAPMEPLSNGNIIFGYSNAIYEYNLMGEEVDRWDISSNYNVHHDIIEKPNGNLVAAVADYDLATLDDIIIEIDRNSGEIVNRWDMREILDIDRYDLLENVEDWFHMNAIWYSESDDCLLVSGRNQGVVKISNENELIWILAPHQGWGKAGVNGDGHETAEFLLTAIDGNGNAYDEDIQNGVNEPADFSWVWGQHAPMYLPNGNLFLFDNGFNRQFNNVGPYSHGVEYIIDEENMTVQMVWEYGKERGAEFFSSIISDVDYLPETENRLITSGITFQDPHYSTLVEVTYPGKIPVFEAKLTYKEVFVPEGAQGWGSLDLTYRSERINFLK